MTAILSHHKLPLKDTPRAKDRVEITCTMWEKTVVLDDGILPEFAPEGCHRRGTIFDMEVPEGWTAHEKYWLCPNCESLWLNKFNQRSVISQIMEG